MWRPLLPVVLASILLSCADVPPAVVKTNGPFVTLTRPKHTSESAVKEVAQSYCDQYDGAHAVMLSTLCPNPACPEPEMTYYCAGWLPRPPSR